VSRNKRKTDWCGERGSPWKEKLHPRGPGETGKTGPHFPRKEGGGRDVGVLYLERDQSPKLGRERGMPPRKEKERGKKLAYLHPTEKKALFPNTQKSGGIAKKERKKGPDGASLGMEKRSAVHAKKGEANEGFRREKKKEQ